MPCDNVRCRKGSERFRAIDRTWFRVEQCSKFGDAIRHTLAVEMVPQFVKILYYNYFCSRPNFIGIHDPELCVFVRLSKFCGRQAHYGDRFSFADLCQGLVNSPSSLYTASWMPLFLSLGSQD